MNGFAQSEENSLMITIEEIGVERKEDINVPNQPFKLFGRLIPAYRNEKWRYAEEMFPQDGIGEMCFPDEKYAYKKASDTVFIGAYDAQNCIGLAVLKQAVFKYMYLYDLKVNLAHRGKHIGKMLLESSKEIAAKQGYKGLYTQAQDNNLSACRFYLRNGFVIGGLDTKVYRGTPQAHKKDVFFYCDLIS